MPVQCTFNETEEDRSSAEGEERTGISAVTVFTCAASSPRDPFRFAPRATWSRRCTPDSVGGGGGGGPLDGSLRGEAGGAAVVMFLQHPADYGGRRTSSSSARPSRLPPSSNPNSLFTAMIYEGVVRRHALLQPPVSVRVTAKSAKRQKLRITVKREWEVGMD